MKSQLEYMDSEFFLNHPENDSLEELFEAVKTGVEFMRGKNAQKAVLEDLEQDKIWERVYEEVPQKGKKLSDVLEEFKTKILRNSINMNHPQYVGFPDIGISSAAQMGNILAGLMNQNMINSQTASPTATFVDITVIQWLRLLLGYKVSKKPEGTRDIGGITVIGGVLANSVGVLLAREKAKSLHPNADIKKFRIFVPGGVSHYSIRRAAFWIGMSEQTTVEIKTDKNFCMILGELEVAIRQEREKGNIPIAVVAYAGNSRTMSIDDLEKIGAICARESVWFHVDACHGFSLAFSDELRRKLKGIHLADSITTDPHKVLFVPYNLSYLLVKNPEDMMLVSEIADICTTEPYSMGSMTPFLGSLAFNSLKFWFLIKHLGRENLGKLIEERHELTKWLAEQLKGDDDFIVLNKVMINSCAFYYLPEKKRGKVDQNLIDKYNEINKRIHERLFKEGEFYVHSFPLTDEGNRISKKEKYKVTCLRVMPGNPLTNKEILLKCINRIKILGREVSKR